MATSTNSNPDVTRLEAEADRLAEAAERIAQLRADDATEGIILALLAIRAELRNLGRQSDER